MLSEPQPEGAAVMRRQFAIVIQQLIEVLGPSALPKSSRAFARCPAALKPPDRVTDSIGRADGT